MGIDFHRFVQTPNVQKRGQMNVFMSMHSETPAQWDALSAALMLRLDLYRRVRDTLTFALHIPVNRLAKYILSFTIAAVVLSQPAIAADSKTHIREYYRKASGRYPTETDLVSIEKNILFFTNKERSARGLPAFRASPVLTYLAKRQTENMCAARTLAHESDRFPKGWKTFTDRLKYARLRAGGENIAYRTLREQPGKWAKEVVKGWMKSPKHRKNILNPRWLYLGVGVQMCPNSIAYATQFFASRPGRLP